MKRVFIDASITSSGVSIYDDDTRQTFLYTYSDKLKEEIKFSVGRFEIWLEPQPKQRKNKPWFPDLFQKYIHISDRINSVIFHRSDSTTEYYIEGYAYSGQGKNFNIGEFGGLLKHGIYKEYGSEFTMTEIPPSEWKKFNTGNGNAPKKMIYDSMMKTKMGEVLAELLVRGYPYKEKSWIEDIVDVYAIQNYILNTI